MMRPTIHFLRVLLILAAVAVPSAPRAQARLVDVDEPAVCYVCHSEIKDLSKLPALHTPFEAGECSSCHNPHASNHAALLADDHRELCLGCHDEFETRSTQAFPHAPVARGECVVCHDPHASEFDNQLKTASADRCVQCHTDVTTWMKSALIHAPVDDGDCDACHDVHGSEQPAMLMESITATCLGCHDADPEFFELHRSRSIAESNCTACHDPHASGRPGLLRTNQHAPFASGSCETCHGQLTPTSSFAVSGVRELCVRCHPAAKDFETSVYHHNLDDEGSCNQCHNPHASNVEFLLARRPATLCMQCHFNEPDRLKPQAEYVTHDGMDCNECHLPHGADNAKYLKSDDSEFCASCHESAHRISHPVGPEVIDARTGEAVTCLSCHAMHGADFDMYLPLDPTRELCIQCHRR